MGFVVPTKDQVSWQGDNVLALPQGPFVQGVTMPEPIVIPEAGKDVNQGSALFNHIGYQVALRQDSFAVASAKLLAAVPSIPGLFARGGLPGVVTGIQASSRRSSSG
ncbi:MAG: hypothetical protein ACRD29_15820 [Acidimicrobiales bacterium]